MSDLHTRILHALAARDTSIVSYHEVNAALRTVVELHKPVPCRDLYPCSLRHEHITCRRCKGPWFPELKHWPCSTIRSIADQLGLTEGTDHRG